MGFKHLKGGYKEGRERPFSLAAADRTRSDGLKMQQGRFRVRKNFLIVRVFQHWSRLPRAGVG